jgi:ABC-2 type transport system permease protein
MNGTILRSGVARGLIELRQSFTNGAELWAHAFWPALMLGTTAVLGRWAFGHSGLALGTLALPGILGMNVAVGLVMMSQQLTADREDGTLLRARATPDGVPAYLVGKVVSVGCQLVADLALFLLPGLLFVPGLAVGGAGWLTVLWVLLLGLLAALPVGAVLGSVFGSSRAQGLLMLPVLALMGISGIFYPLSALPGWLRAVAQVFPLYWLGLGMRSGLLPPGAAALEIGGSWRHLDTALVLLAWAAAGLVLAPLVLRRTARRESGSTMARRRELALRRAG